MKTILILVLLALSAKAFDFNLCMFAGMGAASQLKPQLLNVTSA